MHAALVRLAELLAAASATALQLPLARLPELPGADPAPLRGLPRAQADGLPARHRPGARRSRAGVVDGDLCVHGTESIHVADGSAVPSALGVNPQITIMPWRPASPST